MACAELSPQDSATLVAMYHVPSLADAAVSMMQLGIASGAHHLSLRVAATQPVSLEVVSRGITLPPSVMQQVFMNGTLWPPNSMDRDESRFFLALREVVMLSAVSTELLLHCSPEKLCTQGSVSLSVKNGSLHVTTEETEPSIDALSVLTTHVIGLFEKVAVRKRALQNRNDAALRGIVSPVFSLSLTTVASIELDLAQRIHILSVVKSSSNPTLAELSLRRAADFYPKIAPALRVKALPSIQVLILSRSDDEFPLPQCPNPSIVVTVSPVDSLLLSKNATEYFDLLRRCESDKCRILALFVEGTQPSGQLECCPKHSAPEIRDMLVHLGLRKRARPTDRAGCCSFIKLRKAQTPAASSSQRQTATSKTSFPKCAALEPLCPPRLKTAELSCSSLRGSLGLQHVRTSHVPSSTSQAVRRSDVVSTSFIGQFDKKFLLAVSSRKEFEPQSSILCFDQHAVHERVRLERFLRDIRSHVSVVDIRDSLVELLEETRLLLSSSQELQRVVAHWGWDFSPHYTYICHCPKISIEGHSCALSAESELLEFVCDLNASGLSFQCIPAGFVKFCITRSCRGAIMFGATIERSQCVELLGEVALATQFGVCSHGRRSIVALCAVENSSSERFEVPPPTFTQFLHHVVNN